MKLVSVKGQTVGVTVTIPGSDGLTKHVSVGPEPIDLSEADGKAILNIFGSYVRVVGDAPKTKEPETKQETKAGATNQTEFKPKLDDETKPPAAHPEKLLPKNVYFCTKCKKPHKETSGKGVMHMKYRKK